MTLIISKAAARLKCKLLGLLQVVAAHAIVYWVFRGRTYLKVDRSSMKDLKPPFIVLGNHTSYFDPALVQYAVAPYSCRFLTSNCYFRHPVIGRILSLFGAIPKIQFSPDVRSTRGALAAIARGEVVGIFPEGRRSIDGSCCPIPDSLARFIKKAKVPVVSVKTNGGYFVWPRWSSFRRAGRVETVARQLFTTADISVMDTRQIHNIICQTLDYNEYDWNRDAKVCYSHQKIAEQLHFILHQCPRCLGGQTMRSKGNRLYCSVCGNTAVLDGCGFLQPFDAECVVFDDPVKWTAWQREDMTALLRDDDFQLKATVKELRVADKYCGAYRNCGCGQISLRKEGLYFHGKIDGQMTDLFFPIEILPTISTEFGYDFEICDENHAWWIFIEEEQQIVRLESAISILYQQLSHKLSSVC
ncbi:MAG: lysophospholipid acyltransferase family protein [Negativicutes bacterium]|nr:lysophospholipid acyltransferase family protein [Negativicutes bacterium]